MIQYILKFPWAPLKEKKIPGFAIPAINPISEGKIRHDFISFTTLNLPTDVKILFAGHLKLKKCVRKMAESFFEGRRGWLLVYCLCIVGFGYLIYTFDDLHSCALRNNLFGKTPSLKVKEIYNITKARPPALFKINLQVLKEKNSDHPFPKYSIWGKHRPSRRTLWSCSYKAWKQGNRQKVIVYSVVGGIYKNSSNIEAAMEEVAKFYPGWKVWVYGEKFNRDELSPVLKKYRQLFLCDVEQLSKSLAKLVLVAPGLWRVVPMGDMQIDVILSRDINAKVGRIFFFFANITLIF